MKDEKDLLIEALTTKVKALSLAINTVSGLIQRLESHESGGCCKLDARDERALAWGYEAWALLNDEERTPEKKRKTGRW